MSCLSSAKPDSGTRNKQHHVVLRRQCGEMGFCQMIIKVLCPRGRNWLDSPSGPNVCLATEYSHRSCRPESKNTAEVQDCGWGFKISAPSLSNYTDLGRAFNLFKPILSSLKHKTLKTTSVRLMRERDEKLTWKAWYCTQYAVGRYSVKVAKYKMCTWYAQPWLCLPFCSSHTRFL